MNYHEFFRKVEAYLDKIENQASLRETLGLIIEGILQDFSEDLGFIGARLYVRDLHNYLLEEQFGAGAHAPIGLSLPESYPPIKSTVRKGFVYMDLKSEGVDPALMERIGIRRFAAIAVGPGNKYVIAFGLSGDRIDGKYLVKAITETGMVVTVNDDDIVVDFDIQ